MNEVVGVGQGLGSLRTPPVNLEAEQALLGALLANNKALDRVGESLQPGHFAHPAHARIFEAIRRRVDAGQVADIVTLRAEFENAGTLGEVGGVAYLGQLLTAVVGIINAAEYARVIEDCWRRRQLIDACEVAAGRAYGVEPDSTTAEAVEALEADLLRIAENVAARPMQTADVAAEAAIQAMLAALAREGGLTGVTTGYAGLDRMTGGLRPGDFWVIGARPSMGKTALALGIAARAAAAKANVLFVSAEMAAPAVMARLIAAQAGLPLTAMTRGEIEAPRPEGAPEGEPLARRKLTDREADRLAEAALLVGKLPLVFDDACNTVPGIRARARRMKRRGGLDLIVVDYLGRLRGSDLARRQNRVNEISELTSDLKAMAMELGVPVLLLSQLSREVEKRDDKTPNLSDLRDSGSIEQDADVVGFLYREHYYLTRNAPVRRPKEKGEEFDARLDEWRHAVERSKGKGLLILAKQRQGAIGPVRLRFRDHLTWFSDDSERDDAPAVRLAGGED